MDLDEAIQKHAERKVKFRAAIAKHAVFHRSAGKVADAINAGKYAAAEIMLGGGTGYGVASSAVAGAISALTKEIRQPALPQSR